MCTPYIDLGLSPQAQDTSTFGNLAMIAHTTTFYATCAILHQGIRIGRQGTPDLDHDYEFQRLSASVVSIQRTEKTIDLGLLGGDVCIMTSSRAIDDVR